MQLNLPIPEGGLFGFTTCDNQDRCKTGPIPLAHAFIVAKWHGDGERVYHFCCEACSNDFYMERLRSGL